MSGWSKLEKLANDYVAQIDGDDDDLYQEARDMFEDACDTTTILALIAEINKLKAVISDATYRADQGKVWNGMGWTYTGLSAHAQRKVLDILDAAE